MNESKNDKRILNDQFADFTDQILDENFIQDNAPFAPDPELRALEQTALRLKNAFHEQGPSEEIIHRMRQNILMQWKQHENKVSTPSWKKRLFVSKPSGQKWQSQRSHNRQSLFVSLAALVVLALVSLPLMNKVSSDQPAASGQSLIFSGAVAFVSLVVLAVLFLRRKP